MSKRDKLIARFDALPKDFTWDELETMLDNFGYVLKKKSKTGGSRRAFKNSGTGHVIFIHEPHPSNIIKPSALRQVHEDLKLRGYI